MKKKLLAAGLTMAAIMTITACGSKTSTEPTSEATTAVETTVAESETSEEATTAEGADAESKDAEATEAKEGSEDTSLVEVESETAEEISVEEISGFAKKVQDAVSVSDIDALAELCGYPVSVSLKAGEASEIKSKEELTALGEKIFTDKLMAEIAAVKPEELEVFGAGVIMGEESNIIFNKVDGKVVITGINVN